MADPANAQVAEAVSVLMRLNLEGMPTAQQLMKSRHFLLVGQLVYLTGLCLPNKLTIRPL